MCILNCEAGLFEIDQYEFEGIFKVHLIHSTSCTAELHTGYNHTPATNIAEIVINMQA